MKAGLNPVITFRNFLALVLGAATFYSTQSMGQNLDREADHSPLPCDYSTAEAIQLLMRQNLLKPDALSDHYVLDESALTELRNRGLLEDRRSKKGSECDAW